MEKGGARRRAGCHDYWLAMRLRFVVGEVPHNVVYSLHARNAFLRRASQENIDVRGFAESAHEGIGHTAASNDTAA